MEIWSEMGASTFPKLAMSCILYQPLPTPPKPLLLQPELHGLTNLENLKWKIKVSPSLLQVLSNLEHGSEPAYFTSSCQAFQNRKPGYRTFISAHWDHCVLEYFILLNV